MADMVLSGDFLERFVLELVERLYLGDNTVLAGKLPMDNTSVTFEVLNSLRQRGCYTVQIDLLNVTSIEELGHRLMQKIQDHERASTGTCLEDALVIAQDIAERNRRRMNITIDEWQYIERVGGETLIKQLRSIMQHQSNVVLSQYGGHTKPRMYENPISFA